MFGCSRWGSLIVNEFPCLILTNYSAGRIPLREDLARIQGGCLPLWQSSPDCRLVLHGTRLHVQNYPSIYRLLSGNDQVVNGWIWTGENVGEMRTPPKDGVLCSSSRKSVAIKRNLIYHESIYAYLATRKKCGWTRFGTLSWPH